MAWGDLQPNQFVSYNDIQSGGFTLNSGQSHTNTNQWMTKAQALAKYNADPAYLTGIVDNRWVWKSLLVPLPTSIPCDSTFYYAGDNGSTYARDIVIGTVSGSVPISYNVYNTAGGSQQYLNVDIQYENGAWYNLASSLPIPAGGSISGTLNYPFVYNTSNIITVILQKST